MAFTRRFFVSVAAAASAWGLLPRKAEGSKKKGDTLKERFEVPSTKPEPKSVRPEIRLPCDRIYQVGITNTPLNVSTGEAVFSGCDGKLKPIGMALTDAKAGDPVMLMLGFVPSKSKTP